jgi:hypothetical protein
MLISGANARIDPAHSQQYSLRNRAERGTCIVQLINWLTTRHLTAKTGASLPYEASIGKVGA